jgi:hypothetical protein
VLFWGRRVYWGAGVLVVTALRQGRVVGLTAQRVQALCGVTRPTLTRWLCYFRELFPHTPTWRRLAGRLGPPGRPGELMADLLARFVRARGDPEHGLIACRVALGGGDR